MARHQPLPQSLNECTKPVIESLIEATEGVFPADLSLKPINPRFENGYTTFDGKFHFSSSGDLLNYITTLTGTDDIRSANTVLYNTLSIAPEYLTEQKTEVPQYTENTTESPVNQNMPGYETITGESISKMEEKEAERKEVIAESDREVREAIARKQAIAQRKREIDLKTALLKKSEEKLRQEKIYVELKRKPSKVVLNEKEEGVYKTLEDSLGNPDKLVKDVAALIEERVAKDAPKEISKNEIRANSKTAAYALVQEMAIKNAADLRSEASIQSAIKTPYVQSLITSRIQTTDVLNNKPEIKTEFQKFTELNSEEKSLRILGRQFVSSAFGESMANKIFEDDVEIHLSSSPQDGFVETDLSFGPRYQMDQYSHQSQLLDSVADFGTEISSDKIKNQIYAKTAEWIEEKASSLPANSLLAKTYNSEAVQLGLSSLKFGVPVEWVGTNAFGKFAVASGYGPALGWTGKFTGIDFGVGLATGTTAAIAAGSYTATATSIATTGGIMASEAFLGGAGTAMATGAAAGSVVPGIGTVVGAVVGFVGGLVGGRFVGKLTDKYGALIKRFFQENKEVIFGIGALGTIFGGGAIRIVSVLPLVAGAGAMIAAGGFSGGAFVGGIISFFGALGGALALTIGTPIIVTLLVFPVVVALILFIINSGAYVVPPAPRGEGVGAVVSSPYIEVVKTALPAGPFQNADLSKSPPLTVTYSVEIKAKKGALSNVSVNYSCRVVKKGGSSTCPSPEGDIPSKIDTGISPSTPYKFSYKHTYSSSHQDSFITDTILVKADVEGAKGEESAASATIKIGTPPEECPSIWPTTHGYISQGAYTGSGNSHAAMEAIDVGVSHTPVLAGHSGTVVTTQKDSCLGNYIQIKSSCNGRDFLSQYAHLEGISVRVGSSVAMGQTIGLSGNTGRCTTGPHVHYRFKYYPDGNPKWPSNPPFMMSPYLPGDVPRGCKNAASCRVSF